MKKLIVLILIGALALSSVACGNGQDTDTQDPFTSEATDDESNQSESDNTSKPDAGNDSENTQPSKPEVSLEITDATEILTKTWNSYKQNELFAIVGGHYNHYTDGAPAKYDIAQAEDIAAVFCIPQDALAMMDDVASMQHALNVNNFTAMACHLKDKTRMQIVIDAIRNKTMNNQWICGFPDKLVMITIGEEYLITAFGNAGIVDTFVNKVQSVYENVPQVVVNQNL